MDNNTNVFTAKRYGVHATLGLTCLNYSILRTCKLNAEQKNMVLNPSSITYYIEFKKKITTMIMESEFVIKLKKGDIIDIDAIAEELNYDFVFFVDFVEHYENDEKYETGKFISAVNTGYEINNPLLTEFVNQKVYHFYVSEKGLKLNDGSIEFSDTVRNETGYYHIRTISKEHIYKQITKTDEDPEGVKSNKLSSDVYAIPTNIFDDLLFSCWY